MFTITNAENSIIKIDVKESISLDELKTILGVLTKVMEAKKKYAFIVDCNFKMSASEVPSMSRYVLKWMKESHEGITDYLQASSLVIKSDILVGIFKSIFKIRPTVKPNYITTDYQKGLDFITKVMKATGP